MLDFSIIERYLDDDLSYKEHILFKNITPTEEFCFAEPPVELKEKVKTLSQDILQIFNNFVPFNCCIFTSLFPHWQDVLHNINFIAAVGCPPPYDAMTRILNGKEYMIFDLIRFLGYNDCNLPYLVRQMVTHELTHLCLHGDYPYPSNRNYKEMLTLLTFDEGFAHLLAFTEDVSTYNFTEVLAKHYQKNLNMLFTAYNETNTGQQESYLLKANTAPSYWDKFAAISGKLYLASHLNMLQEIYKNGPAKMLNEMLGSIDKH